MEVSVAIKDKLYKQIKEYCKYNNLDESLYLSDIMKMGFMVDKYGEKPAIQQKEVYGEKVEETDTKQQETEENKIKDKEDVKTIVVDVELPKVEDKENNDKIKQEEDVEVQEEEDIEEVIIPVERNKAKKRKLK